MGNLEARRDFIDVRDVARAMITLAQAAGPDSFTMSAPANHAVSETDLTD